jgi:hypothetical protein
MHVLVQKLEYFNIFSVLRASLGTTISQRISIFQSKLVHFSMRK